MLDCDVSTRSSTKQQQR